MGVGSSAQVLPVDRDDMASCVERLTQLQQKLESAGVWSATEREAVRDALEHSRGVYSLLIDEAPALRDDLQKLRAELLTDFSRLYESMYLILAKEPGFAEFNTQADRCASNAPQQTPRQETQHLEQLYETGAVSARAPFASLLDAARQTIAGADVSVAPLKKMSRTIEKSLLRPEAERRGEVDGILDVVRGMVTCGSMNDLKAALAFFSEADHGWKIVRVKNRFTGERTSGGWADCLLNIVRSDDPHQHICEVQLVHESMLLLRKRLGGHDAYHRYRTADEVLLVISGGADVFAPVRHMPRVSSVLRALGVQGEVDAEPVEGELVTAEPVTAEVVGVQGSSRPGWSAHQNIDMCGQGDVEIIHNWRATHSIEDLQRIVEQKGYSAFTVSSGQPSFGHAALKKFPYQLTAGHCKPITTCCNHPCTIYIWSGGGAAEGPAAEIYKPPGSGATEDGPKLVLTSKGSSSALYFENAAGLHQKGGALLTLRGGNMAVVPRYDYPRDAGEWSYIELGLGPRGMAMRVRLDGDFLVRVHDERVFDIAHWKYKEGNNLVLLRSSTFHPDHTRKAPGGRSFVVNPDGTISPKFAQHLVLGGQQPTFSFVPAESPLVCRFRRAEALAAGKKVPLRLASHPGLAVVQVFDKPREAHHEWYYKTLGIGPASKAVVASRQGSFFVDKAGWYVCPSGLKVHKGNHTDLVVNRYIHPARIQEEHRKRGEERPLEYEFHADGSVAPASAPHLRLGCSCPPAAAASGKSDGSACCVVS